MVQSLGEWEEDLAGGFTRRLVTRKSGSTAGDIDIYVTAPDGTRLRSRPELRRFLEAHPKFKVDVEAAFAKPLPGVKSPVKIVPKDSSTFKVLNAPRNLSKKQRDGLAKDAGMGEAVVNLKPFDSPPMRQTRKKADKKPEVMKVKLPERPDKPQDDKGKENKAKEAQEKPKKPADKPKMVSKKPESSAEKPKIDAVSKKAESSAEKPKMNSVSKKTESSAEKPKNISLSKKSESPTEKPKMSAEKQTKSLEKKESAEKKEKVAETRKKKSNEPAEEAPKKKPKVVDPPIMGGTGALPKIRRLSDIEKKARDEASVSYHSPLEDVYGKDTNEDGPDDLPKVQPVLRIYRRKLGKTPEQKISKSPEEKTPKSPDELLKTSESVPESPENVPETPEMVAVTPEGNVVFTEDQVIQMAEVVVSAGETMAVVEPMDEAGLVPEEEPENELSFLDIMVEPAPHSPYALVYEELAQEPWKVVLASYLQKKFNSTSARCVVLTFFEKFPTPESINFNQASEFFKDTGAVRDCEHLAENVEQIAQSLVKRVARLNQVPCITKYMEEVFKIFCLGQFNEADLDLQNLDLRTYVQWRLANTNE